MNKCFYVNLTSVHSKENRLLCDSLNASMVSIHSAEENEFLRRLIFIHYDSHKWVWLSRARNFNKSHNYLWSDESPFDYSNWVGPETDCSVCCEISVMTSGHWFGSNCNSWSFAQVCQRVLSSTSSSMDAEESLRSLDGNFYLRQFNPRQSKESTTTSPVEPNITELIEWLSYEVEGFRHDIVKLENRTAVVISLENILRNRDSYLLILLSVTVSLLMMIFISIFFIYYMLHKRVREFGSFCNDSIH